MPETDLSGIKVVNEGEVVTFSPQEDDLKKVSDEVTQKAEVKFENPQEQHFKHEERDGALIKILNPDRVRSNSFNLEKTASFIGRVGAEEFLYHYSDLPKEDQEEIRAGFAEITHKQALLYKKGDSVEGKQLPNKWSISEDFKPEQRSDALNQHIGYVSHQISRKYKDIPMSVAQTALQVVFASEATETGERQKLFFEKVSQNLGKNYDEVIAFQSGDKTAGEFLNDQSWMLNAQGNLDVVSNMPGVYASEVGLDLLKSVWNFSDEEIRTLFSKSEEELLEIFFKSDSLSDKNTQALQLIARLAQSTWLTSTLGKGLVQDKPSRFNPEGNYLIHTHDEMLKAAKVAKGPDETNLQIINDLNQFMSFIKSKGIQPAETKTTSEAQLTREQKPVRTVEAPRNWDMIVNKVSRLFSGFRR